MELIKNFFNQNVYERIASGIFFVVPFIYLILKGGTYFDGDISTWDVSRVKDMRRMFMGAISFKQQLCGAA